MSELLLEPHRPTPIAGDDAGIPRRPRLRQQGLRYPADPPKVEEVVAVVLAAGDRAHGRRLRGLIAILWRSGCAYRKRSLSWKVTSITPRVALGPAGGQAALWSTWKPRPRGE